MQCLGKAISESPHAGDNGALIKIKGRYLWKNTGGKEYAKCICF